MARIKTGTGLDGKSNAFARPGEATLSAHHSPMAARATDHLHGDGSIARNGAPKRLADVPVHNGMHPRAIAAAGIGGQGHGTATIDGGQTVVSSAAAAPLASAYGGGIPKTRKAAPVSPGMRSRTNAAHSAMPLSDLGRAILDEALCDQNTKDALGYGRLK